MADLNSIKFRQLREPMWRELHSIVQRVEASGFSRLSQMERQRLPELYRLTLSSLSVARSISADANLIAYLENLSKETYLILYAPRRSFFAGLRRLITTTFPTGVRALLLPVLLATVTLTFGVVVGYLFVAQDSSHFYSIVNSEMAGGRDPTATREQLLTTLGGVEGV